MIVCIRDADVEGRQTKRGGARGGMSIQAQTWLATSQSHDLDLTPGHGHHARAERLGTGFFGGETPDQTLDTPSSLLALGLCEDAAQETLAEALEGPQDTRALDKINADGNRHRRGRSQHMI